MIIREALVTDVPAIQVVRNAVKENRLSDPAVVSDADCIEFLTQRGKGWIAVVEERIVGFSIVDLKDHNVWALFMQPEFEGMGIGRQLHDLMLNWYFQQTKQTIWLGTDPGTRAAGFYRKAGWTELGKRPGSIEIKFEMTYEDWLTSSSPTVPV